MSFSFGGDGRSSRAKENSSWTEVSSVNLSIPEDALSNADEPATYTGQPATTPFPSFGGDLGLLLEFRLALRLKLRFDCR